MKKLLLLITILFTYSFSAQTADEYFNKAKQQVSKRKYYKAIPNYKKAIELDSTNVDYKWFLSEAILRENIRGSHRTEDGVFEALAVLDKMPKKGIASIKIYERIANANQYVLDDYFARYNKIDAIDNTDKERFKNIALKAYNAILNSNNKILELAPENKNAKSNLKYLKKPKF
jgi:tetratricopeptide (TPR) repeat protein